MAFLAIAVGYFALEKFVLLEQREASIAEVAREKGRGKVLVELYGDQSLP